MVVAFSHVDAVGLGVRGNHKHGVRVTADAQALSLANGIELSALMPAHDAAAGVLLVTGFLDVMLPAAVGFGLKFNGIMQRR